MDINSQEELKKTIMLLQKSLDDTRKQLEELTNTPSKLDLNNKPSDLESKENREELMANSCEDEFPDLPQDKLYLH